MVGLRRFYRTYRAHVDWTFIAVVVITVLVLGKIGFEKNLALTEPEKRYSHSTLVYLALQLLLLDSGAVAEPSPWELETARALAVATFFAAVLKTAFAVFRQRVDDWRALRSRKHTVVCGADATGRLLVAERLAMGERVVVIDDDPRHDLAELRDLGALVVGGDAMSGATLERAGVRRANRVMIAVGDDVTNLQVAAAAGRLCHEPDRHPPTAIDVLCVDPRLFGMLEPVSNPGQESGPAGVEYRRFDPLFEGARALLDEYPLDREQIDADSTRTVQLVLLGYSRESECLLLQTARLGHYANALRPKVRIADPDAEACEQRLRFRFPQIDNVLDLQFLAAELDHDSTRAEVDRWLNDQNLLSTIVVSPQDEDDSLPVALGLSTIVSDRALPVFVRLSHREELADLLTARFTVPATAPTTAPATIPGAWRPFGELTGAGIAKFVIQAGQDRQARAIHEDYVRRREERGDKPSQYPAMRPWEKLSEAYREANRHQADHIPVKLRAVGCATAAISDLRSPAEWTDGEVEILAAMEHARWNANRWLEGWRLGPRDDGRKTHPKLVPWADLDEPTRQYDRDAVRQIPELLKMVGQKVVRLATVRAGDDPATSSTR